MASERIQRRIDLLLDEADDAIAKSDWGLVRDRAKNVLALDPDNPDAQAMVAAADRAQASPTRNTPESPGSASSPVEHPTSFADGRYEVKEFLGEGGKKQVYLAQDTLLDRQVAFALIKTEGLDENSRSRVTREAQANEAHFFVSSFILIVDDCSQCG